MNNFYAKMNKFFWKNNTMIFSNLLCLKKNLNEKLMIYYNFDIIIINCNIESIDSIDFTIEHNIMSTITNSKMFKLLWTHIMKFIRVRSIQHFETIEFIIIFDLILFFVFQNVLIVFDVVDSTFNSYARVL